MILWLIVGLFWLGLSPVYARAGQVLAWGNDLYDQTDVPAGLNDAAAVAAGGSHCLAVRSNGTLIAWGWNLHGQTNVPAGLTGVKAAAAGGGHSLALKNDGTVVAWGYDFYGQAVVPRNLSSVMRIACGGDHTLTLRSNGTVVAWGKNSFGQTNVPAGLSGVLAIAGGKNHTVALRSTGTVLAWGANFYGQTNVPAGLNNVAAIAAGGYHCVALKHDGTVVAWGHNADGQTNVPSGLSDVVAVSAGAYHSLALKSDGSVVSWGRNEYGQATVPAGTGSLQIVAGGDSFNVGISRGTTLPSADLTVIATVSTNALAVGQTVAYTIQMANSGSVAASGVFLTNRLPAGLDLVSASVGQGSYTSASGTVIFNLGSLAAGSSVSATLQAVAVSGGRLTNYAEITSSVPDPVPSNNKAITVVTVNGPPVFDPILNQTVNEGALLSFASSAADSDTPPNALTFSLVSGPMGASVTANGLFTWTPGEADGPGTHAVTLRVVDDGVPSLSATRSFTIQVVEVNSAPIIAPVPDQLVSAGGTVAVSVTATDPDLPANALSFELVSGPTGATLTTDGQFSWTPAPTHASGTNLVVVRVSDDGTPSLSATQSFAVAVIVAQPLVFQGIEHRRGSVSYYFNAAAGYGYEVQSRLPSGEWTTLANLTTPSVTSNVVVADAINDQLQRFYRVRNLSIPHQTPRVTALGVGNGMFQLLFVAEAGRSYTVEWRQGLTLGVWQTLTNINVPEVYSTLSGSAALNPSAELGQYRVNRLSLPVPLQRFDGIERAGMNLLLRFTTVPGLSYVVETCSDLDWGNWSTLTNINPTAVQSAVQVSDKVASGANRFYRLRIPVPSVPVSIPPPTVVPNSVNLRFPAEAGRIYTIQYRGSLTSGTWQDLQSVGPYPTNGVQVFTDTNVSQPQKFYRLKSP